MGGTPVRFTPLYGVHGGQPLCYLLELGGFVILLDCGWNDHYDPALLRPLHDVLDHVDVVLLSHPDPQHLGALPYLVGRLGLAARVYGTGPVHKMGQMFMYDAFLCRASCSEFDVFNLDDVDAAFGPQFTTLRYQQDVALEGEGAGITLTPFAAGHLLGGTLWRIRKDDDDYVYAVHYNHRKERHLSGTVLESAFSRPALLITDALNAGSMAPERPGKDKELLDCVLTTLRGDGNVLLPIDSAGRVLELVLLFERAWAEGRLTYPLALLSPMASNMLEFAKSQLEWMNEALTRSLGHTRDNPFNTRFLKLCTSREELGRLPQGPKLVLATLPSLEAGPSRQLLVEWGGDPRNAVIFCTQPEEGTLAQQVLHLAQQAQQAQQAQPPTLSFTMSRRVALEGEELEQHLAAQQAAAEAAAGGLEGGTEQGGSGGAGAEPMEGSSPRAARKVTRIASGTIARLQQVTGGGGEAAVAELPELQPATDTAACLIEGFTVPPGAAGPMFPFENAWEGVSCDEYGAAINLADFDMSEQKTELQAMASELEGEKDVPAAAAPPDIPTKVVTEQVALQLRARVLHFNYDGRSDGRSMRTMLAHVAPRRCALVHGSSEAKAGLQAYLQQELAGLHVEVFAPAEGESVDIPAEPSYRVALSEGVMAGVRFHPVMADYHLAWINGRAAAATAAEGGCDRLLVPAKGAAGGGEEADEGSAYGGVFIGDIRLSELKKALAGVDIVSEFHGGVLYCAGGVAVRRQGGEEGSSSLVVEGPLSKEYYRIRDVVYGQYHVC